LREHKLRSFISHANHSPYELRHCVAVADQRFCRQLGLSLSC